MWTVEEAKTQRKKERNSNTSDGNRILETIIAQFNHLPISRKWGLKPLPSMKQSFRNFQVKIMETSQIAQLPTFRQFFLPGFCCMICRVAGMKLQSIPNLCSHWRKNWPYVVRRVALGNFHILPWFEVLHLPGARSTRLPLFHYHFSLRSPVSGTCIAWSED